MNKVNKEGIIIYGEDMVYFDDWLKVNYGEDQESMRAALLCEYGNSEMVDDRMDCLEEYFYDYCEANEYTGETV